MKRLILFAAGIVSSLPVGGAEPDPPATTVPAAKSARLDTMNQRFDGETSAWWSEGGRAVAVEAGHLLVDANTTSRQSQAATVWMKLPISGDVEVSFDAHVEASVTDVNNINLFLFYSDPSGKPLRATADERNDGAYNKYHQLSGYIITFVKDQPDATSPPKARMRIRRCPGFELLAETFDYHCEADRTYHFEIARQGDNLTLAVDGKNRLTAVDKRMHTSGLLGFRTYRTKLWWDNLVVQPIAETTLPSKASQ